MIVSDVLPNDDLILTQVDGLWACKLEAAGEIASALRQGIVQAALAHGATARRDDLKGRVYDYLVSATFVERITSVVTSACQIREGIDAERGAFGAKWAERERQANAIIEDLAAVYGELRGIGASVGSIDTLELEALPKALSTAGSASARTRRFGSYLEGGARVPCYV